MDTINTISLLSSIASLVLSVVAIFLSITFYKMSTEQAEKAKEASKDIESSVQKLEKLFDKLYSDTFSMMRETVSDMRGHIWPKEQTSQNDNLEKVTEEKIEELKNNLEKDFYKITKHQDDLNEKNKDFKEEIRELLDNAITGSQKVVQDAKVESIRESVVSIFHIKGSAIGKNGLYKMTISELFDNFSNKYEATLFFKEINKMYKEKLVEWDEKFEAYEYIPGNEIIYLVK